MANIYSPTPEYDVQRYIEEDMCMYVSVLCMTAGRFKHMQVLYVWGTCHRAGCETHRQKCQDESMPPCGGGGGGDDGDDDDVSRDDVLAEE